MAPIGKTICQFNIPALQQAAGKVLGTRCVQMTKQPEGMYNKLRNVLNVPVPRVMGWSSPSQPNSVGSKYMMIGVVEIERKLMSARFTSHGSLYYKDAYPYRKELTGKFVIGPTTERSFWENGKHDLDIDRGPWDSAQEYLSAVANREIASIQNQGSKTAIAMDSHVRLLEQVLTLLPHILPLEELSSPALLHHDLHSDNIFVDDADPTKISSIIDWRAVYSAPLSMQARFPSVFDCDDQYPWGAVHPELPEDFDTLSQTEKELARDKLARLRLKKSYELASRKFDPLLVKAMDVMRNDDDPTTFIFHTVGQSSLDGPIPLKELLIQVYEKWDQIAKRRGLKIPCPIPFSQEEIEESRQQAAAWADAYTELDTTNASHGNENQEKVVAKSVRHFRLQNERDILLRFQNRTPCIRPLIDELEDSTIPPTLILRYLDDDALRASNHQRLTRPEVKYVAKTVLEGLSVLHDEGFVHTDIKPSNVLVKYDHGDIRFADVQLADFGSTVHMDSLHARRGDSIGTPIFRSPEAHLQMQWGPATDIWSFGAMAS
ncbi:hypothetical protein CNMCM6069_004353 [Aspergillus lentulus]|nr:hypothetical protein CNMCM6069_004353 [Aspergillus lentulus]